MADREIHIEEVKLHNKEDDLWIIIHNNVYDVTKFLNEHPGGPEALTDNAGKDGTKEFDDVGHSQDAKKLLVKYKIGKLCSSGSGGCARICEQYIYHFAIAAAVGLVVGMLVKKCFY